MRKTMYIFLIGVLVMGYAYAQTKSEYSNYIDNGKILNATAQELEKAESTYTDELDKALVIFRKARLNNADEALVLSAFEYWQALYEKPAYRNAMTLAYVATLESMYAGAINAGAIKKTRLVKSSVKKFEAAQAEVEPMNDPLAKYNIYFLMGRTYTGYPTFFSEFKKEVAPSLETALDYIKKADKLEVYTEQLIANLYANVYTSYGLWYTKKEEYSKATRAYKKAISYIEKYEPNRVESLNAALLEVKDK